MARTQITVQNLTDAGSAPDSGTAIDNTNGHYFTLNGATRRHVIEVVTDEPAGSGGTLTLKAGPNPPNRDAAAGDRSITIPDNARVLIPIPPGRHFQAARRIHIDCTSLAGVIRVYRLPA